MLVSSTMVAQTRKNSWSQLLTFVLRPKTAGLRFHNATHILRAQSEQSCTELPALTCHRKPCQNAKGEYALPGWTAIRETRSFSHGPCRASVPCPCSQSACLPGGFSEEVVWDRTTRRRLRVTTDVSILRTHHAALRNMLPGVRQVAQTSLKVENGVELTRTLRAHPDCTVE